MAGLDHKRTFKIRPGFRLAVAAFAWLNIMVMPCTVFAAAATTEKDDLTANVQVECHGDHGIADSTESECRCDPLSSTSGERFKSERAHIVVATVPSPAPVHAIAVVPSTDRARPPPGIESDLPVYLSTQRLRI